LRKNSSSGDVDIKKLGCQTETQQKNHRIGEINEIPPKFSSMLLHFCLLFLKSLQKRAVPFLIFCGAKKPHSRQ